MATTQPNWAVLITKLMQAGMTQTQIAKACDVSQRQISHLARGETTDPGYSLGARLVELSEPGAVSVTWLTDGSALINVGQGALALTALEVTLLTNCLNRPKQGA